MASVLPRFTVSDLVLAMPAWDVQVTLALFHAFLWHVVLFYVLPPFSRAAINSLRSREQFLTLNGDMYKKIFQLDFGDDRNALLEHVVLFQGVILQHFIGGLLCVPSVLGLGSPALSAALACQGGLCEVGWEIQDTLVRVKELLFDGEAGRKRNPLAFMVTMTIHHTCAQFLVLPMNMYYRDCAYYHEGILLLQLAAGVSGCCQQFGFTLDVSNTTQLWQMRMCMWVNLCVIFWSRLLRYSYVAYMIFETLHGEGDAFMMSIAAVPGVLMTFFNVFVLVDCYKKFEKFVLKNPDQKAMASKPNENHEASEQRPDTCQQGPTLLSRRPKHKRVL